MNDPPYLKHQKELIALTVMDDPLVNESVWSLSSSPEAQDSQGELEKRLQAPVYVSKHSSDRDINKSVGLIRRTSQSSSDSKFAGVNGNSSTVNTKSSPAGPFTTEDHAEAPTEVATPSSNSGFLDSVLTSLSEKKDESTNSVTSPTMMSYRRTPRAKKRGASTSSIDITSPLTEAPKPYTTFSYDTNLYVEEKFKDTDYRYATIPRNEEFHKLFKSVSQSDRLLDDFSCALSRDILLQGRVYVSEHNICFNSNLLGWVTNLVIPLPDITGFEKTSTVGLFPNGIAISSKEGKNSFASFISRDGVFEFLETVWKASGGVPSTIDHSGDTQTSQVSSLLQLNGMPVLSKGLDLDQDSSLYTVYGGALMSLDSDNSRKSSMTSDDVEEEQTDNSEVVEEKVSSQKVHVLKPDSKYSYIGTHGHGVTHCPYKPEDNKETILARVNLNCPPGVLYEFLFGSNFTMLNEFLRTQDSRDFSDVSEYETNADKKKERHYEYIKDLNYSVGPKQTRCIVTETIEHYDTDGYINVVNTTQTPDVPSGNAFCVKTRYIMTWGKGNTTDLVISYWVHWTGSSWMKSIIEKSTKGGQESAAKALLDKIKEVLEENVQESTEEVSTAVKADEEEQEEQEKAELAGSPVETVLPSTSPITTILEGVSIFNVLVIVLLSLIVVLQFQILRGLNGSSRLVFDFVDGNDNSIEGDPSRRVNSEAVVWNWLDDRIGTLNESRREELDLLQREIDVFITKWTTGDLDLEQTKDLLNQFQLSLHNYANGVEDDERRKNLKVLKDAINALL